jgi:hypothetical protein
MSVIIVARRLVGFLGKASLIGHLGSLSAIKMEEKNNAGEAEPLRICSGRSPLQMRFFASTVTSW